MQPFRFTSELRTGIQAIDRQHVEWFQALETLRKAVEAGAGEGGQVGKALAFAVRYTQQHFADEENAMREAGYPGFEAHRALHASLVTKLNELTAAHGDERDVAHEVLGLMSAWITAHIAEADRAYVPSLAAR
jgi:hemerythrin-like metal-binding protein